MKATPAERLQQKLAVKDSGCIEWIGGKVHGGYGKVTIDKQWWRTHRLAWELTNGTIPDGLNVLHHCDNPPCCNVEHLFLGTRADNNADMRAKGRQRNGSQGVTKCPADHPYDAANTYLTPNGKRDCRRCRADAAGRYRARRRAVTA